MSSRYVQPLPRLANLRVGIVLTALAACSGNASTLVADSDTGATRVVIVRSKEVEPFRQAEASFISSLPDGIQSQAFALADATTEILSKAAGDPDTAFFAIGSEAAASVKAAIPAANMLTCAMVSDPAAMGVFDSRTTTVISMECPHAAQITFISRALPKVRRLGVLYRSDTPRGKKAVDAMRAALPSGWAIEAIAVDKEASVSDAITRMFDTRIDLVWTYPDSSLYDMATIKTLLLESLRQTIPVFGFSPAFVRAGAVIGVGTTPADQGRQAAATFKPARGNGGDGDDLIIPPDMSTYVNTVVAERLDIVLPPAVISSAATVFKGE